jgi:hypothetical protein
LPPGAYDAVALDDVAYDDVRDPGFLEGLIPRATRLTLAEGERRTVPLRVVRVP